MFIFICELTTFYRENEMNEIKFKESGSFFKKMNTFMELSLTTFDIKNEMNETKLKESNSFCKGVFTSIEQLHNKINLRVKF
jgi:hypothetical protein